MQNAVEHTARDVALHLLIPLVIIPSVQPCGKLSPLFERELLDTDEAFATKVPAELDKLPVFFLSKTLLNANKRAVGRPQDMADFTELE